MTKPERSVEEIVEEFQEKFPATKMTTGTAFVANGDKVIDWLTQTLQAERQKREEVVRNHLETLEDALNDPDLYGAINGMAHALREHLTQPNNK